MKRLNKQREAIARKFEACAHCTQKCLMVHGKDSSHVISFFKIMIGDQFTKVLFLPPMIAPTMSLLVDTDTCLKDSNGEQWEVKVSNVNESYAFIQGWEAFSLDHGLEVGDFVVFKYITGSHFDVKIYTNTGCEKLNFSVNNIRKKRTKTSKSSVIKDGRCHRNHKYGMNKYSSSDVVEEAPMVTEKASNLKNCKAKTQPMPKVEYSDELNFIIDSDLEGGQGEDIHGIFDLTNFEMEKKRSAANRGNIAAVGDESLHKASTPPRIQVEAENSFKNPVAEPEASRHHRLTKSSLRLGENGENNSDMSGEYTRNCHIGLGRDNAHSRKESKIIKREYMQDCSASHSTFVRKVVKPESFDSVRTYAPTVANFSCVIYNDRRSFLELPISLLPSYVERKTAVVYLRDQFMRLWPVLYLESLYFKLLTKGWEAFSIVNNLEPGDTCIFEVEKEDIYRVRIV